jgi:hypothetical protein
MFQAAKDALASRAAQAWANNLIARYGRVEHLKIDSRQKTLEASCLLEGEDLPITVRVEDYVLETEAGHTFIRATRFTCNRPWLQNILMDHARQRRVELPPLAAASL